MEAGLVMGIAIAVISGSISFAVGRWLSRKRRAKKAQSDLLATRAAQSRQVRRAQQRKR